MTNLRIDKEGRYEPASAVELELRQFNRLRELSDPPLTSRDIAHRMGWTQLYTRKMLNTYKDKRK